MNIDVELLKKQCLKIEQIIDSYELDYLNFYNILKESMNYWQDDYSKRYIEQLNYQKNESDKIILDLKDLKKLLNSITIKYEPIAKKIYYLKENKDSLSTIFIEYKTSLTKTINFLNNLDLSLCLKEQETILKIKNDLNSTLKKIISIEQKVKKTINEIEQKEIEVNNLVSKFPNTIIKELEIHDFI